MVNQHFNIFNVFKIKTAFIPLLVVLHGKKDLDFRDQAAAVL